MHTSLREATRSSPRPSRYRHHRGSRRGRDRSRPRRFLRRDSGDTRQAVHILPVRKLCALSTPVLRRYPCVRNLEFLGWAVFDGLGGREHGARPTAVTDSLHAVRQLLMILFLFLPGAAHASNGSRSGCSTGFALDDLFWGADAVEYQSLLARVRWLRAAIAPRSANENMDEELFQAKDKTRRPTPWHCEEPDDVGEVDPAAAVVVERSKILVAAIHVIRSRSWPGIQPRAPAAPPAGSTRRRAAPPAPTT